MKLGCCVGKWLGVTLGFKLCNTVGILLGICDDFLMGFALGRKLDSQEGLLDGDCVGYLLGVVLDEIIGISVSKPDGDKVGRWIGRILGTVLNTLLGNCEGFSLYWAFNNWMCTGGLMHDYLGWDWNGHWEAHMCFVIVIH